MSDSQKDMECKTKEVIEKLKTGEFITKAKRPLSSHDSLWEHLSRIKFLNNEYQPFVQCRLRNEILSQITGLRLNKSSK